VGSSRQSFSVAGNPESRDVEAGRHRQPGVWARVVVRVLDLVIAAFALILAAPVLVAAATAVRLESPGPAIFRQRRLGLHKRAFTVYKFRTMRAEADPAVHRAYIEELIRGDEQQHSNGRRNLYKLVADDRITRVGRILRRTSLDELPQLFNVLRGQMSIVGPRPVVPYETEIYPAHYNRRFEAKPGLTGLWQVSGRSSRTYREMVALDIAWVERKSIALYLLIVARTPWVLVRGRNAG
jgi:lipopolysaccharide/colanic/teichoic acid biosynthesis glycosyltransferase